MRGNRAWTGALAVAFLAALLTGCGSAGEDVVVLRVANSEEYIDEGLWDEDEAIELSDTVILAENALVDDFEAWYYETYGVRVRVDYSTYGTNEELYNQMSLGNVFDLACPSEYMIMKLLDEGKLEPLSASFFAEDASDNDYIRNVSPYIDKMFASLYMGDVCVRDYAAGYMWGTMGIVYDPSQISEEEVAHWRVLNDPAHYKRVTMKDSVRDSYIVAMSILHEEEVMQEAYRRADGYYENLTALLNDTSAQTVSQVGEILTAMRKNCYSLETDSGKADMITGKVIANMQWSGDAVYTIAEAAEDGYPLCYSVPQECSNLWFDGWVMLKDGIAEDARKKQAAEAFLNYISRPENAIRNMYYIGYTSAISGGESALIRDYIEYMYGAEGTEEDIAQMDLSYFFGEDYVLETTEALLKGELGAQYPTEDEIARCVIMQYFDREANERIMRMWTNIRCFSLW